MTEKLLSRLKRLLECKSTALLLLMPVKGMTNRVVTRCSLCFRVQVVFSFQSFGHKQILETKDAVENFIDTIENSFEVSKICDSSFKRFENTSFLQDLAFAIV